MVDLILIQKNMNYLIHTDHKLVNKRESLKEVPAKQFSRLLKLFHLANAY